MKIYLSRLVVKCTRNTVEIVVELARPPQENIDSCLQALNRVMMLDDSSALLSPSNDLSALAVLMNNSNISSGLWTLDRTSATQFKLVYHDREVVAHRAERRDSEASDCFAAKKQKLFLLSLLDLIHVFNSQELKRLINLSDLSHSELRFNFSAIPLFVELRDPMLLQLPYALSDKLRGLPAVMEKIKSEIKIFDFPMTAFHEAYQIAISDRATLSDETVSALKALHIEFEGLLILYLKAVPQRSADYYFYLNTLAEVRQILRAVVLLALEQKLDLFRNHYSMARKQADEFLMAKSDGPIIIKADGYPLADQKWPRDRELKNIEKLHTAQSPLNLFSETLNPSISFLDEVPRGVLDPIIVDIGAGSGRGLFDLLKSLSAKGLQPKCIAVGVTPLNPDYECALNAVFYTPIPDMKQLLKHFEGSVDFIIDTYGASTYASNPLFALAYYAKLLRPEGKFKGIISGVQQLPDGTPTGFVLTRAKIKDFFDILGYSFKIHETTIRSQVEGFENTTMQDYLITFEKPSLETLCLSAEKSFDELCHLVETEVGKPVKYEHSDSFGKFSKFLIAANVYGGDKSQLTTRNLMEIGLQEYFIESGFIEGGPQMRYSLSFSNPRNAKIFSHKLSELYGFRGDDDWLVKIEEAYPCQVLLSFCPSDARLEYYSKKWRQGVPHEKIAATEVTDNAETRLKWEKMWLDANSQLLEHFDIPGLDTLVSREAAFIIPSQNHPARLSVRLANYDPDEKTVVLHCKSTDDSPVEVKRVAVCAETAPRLV